MATIGTRGASRPTRQEGSRPGAAAVSESNVLRVPPSRTILASVQCMLWGRSAGRCQFDNCNKVLSVAPATRETRNIAEKAHIYAFSAGGPRASEDWPDELLNDVSNLLLVCHDCHVLIDRADGPQRYTAEHLLDMKRRHERRIQIATGVAAGLDSHVLTYATSVGLNHALPAFRDAADAMFPRHFPASTDGIDLGTRGGSQHDHNDAFWAEQRRELAYAFNRQVREPAGRGSLAHLSIFALAPQPLLIQLGALVGDILPADTYQRHREPAGWSWPIDPPPVPAFVVSEPPVASSGPPALVLSVSATITPERITRVLGENAAIWTVTVPEPHNDVVKTPAMVSEFRRCMRRLLDRIKAAHGHTTPVHVFPALPVSLAVELGRVRMPKADVPWHLYDEQQSRGGFMRAFILESETSQ